MIVEQKAPPRPVDEDEVDAGSPSLPEEGAIRVLKFGGSSLRDAERIRNVAALVSQAQTEAIPVVVVSAVGGTTEALDAVADLSGQGNDTYRDVLKKIEERHGELLASLAPEAEREELQARVNAVFEELERLARGAQLLGECSLRTRDRILAFGELLSALLLAACLRSRGVPARDVDARDFIRTDDRFGNARVDQPASEKLIREHLPGEAGIPVVTGFVGSTASGDTTTLGRGASDYTATLLGVGLKAQGAEIWTDVDGILTADPRTVPEASSVREIGYEELLELAYFGAEVMCPPAVEPARKAALPLRIRSTLEPGLPGTLVVPRPAPDPARPVRGISAIRNVALIRLEGVEQVGIAETSERLFRALRSADVDPLLFTQDSSAHSISLAVSRAKAGRAVSAIQVEFQRERDGGLLDDPMTEENRSILAIVGEGMRETPGIAGRLFSTLGDAKVNIHAVAQGSSERNISWVVSSDDEAVALRAVHRAFFTPPDQPYPVRIVVLGVGSVGSAFLDQLRDHGETALAPRRIRPVLVGVARSRTAAFDLEGLDPTRWREALAEGKEDPVGLVKAASGGGPLVVVDCTASREVAFHYPEYLRAGAAIVTANKIAFSESAEEYKAVRESAFRGGGGVHYETTVGAGLRMIRTVAELRRSGDRILSMEGVLSGTLSFLFDQVNRGTPFSEAVREAQRQGISEPDPREDLGLTDVVRKLVILGRTAGYDLEPGNVEVEPLLPDHLLQADSVEAFLEGLSEVDTEFATRIAEAGKKGCRLVSLARIEPSSARISLAVLPQDHPAARLGAAENILEIRSDRYSESPIFIQGPGAGPRVTAAGLMTDLVAGAEQVTHGLRKPIDGS